jgi:hypothetical protein
MGGVSLSVTAFLPVLTSISKNLLDIKAVNVVFSFGVYFTMLCIYHCMVENWSIMNLKYLKGSGCGLIKILSQNLPAGTGENLSQGGWCPSQYSN